MKLFHKIILAATFFMWLGTVASAQLRLRADNVEEVLGAMTVKEKATIVVGAGYKSMVAAVIGLDVPTPGAAGMTRGVSRLGIPQIVLSDGPAGVRIAPIRKGRENKGKTFYCTGFPVGTLLACSWNTELVENVGVGIGEEALAYGVDVMLSPGMNLHRNPLCGRNFEYFSEDPLLTGKMAAAYVRGVQSNGVGTSVKHFAANNQETNRFANDSRVDEETLRELYLKGFEIAIKESQPWTVMASYNKLNGVYAQADPFLLTDVLRGEWGFKGLVMTDWTGKRTTSDQIKAGDDLMEPGAKSQIRELVRKVKKGELEESTLDISARRVLELVVKTPTFNGTERSGAPDLEAHAAFSRSAAEEGMVLLKNDEGALPLAPGLRVALFGTASYSLLAGGTGSGHVNRPYIVDVEDGMIRSGYQVNTELSEIYHDYLKKNAPRKTIMRKLMGAPAAPEMTLHRSVVEKFEPLTDVAVYTLARQAGESDDRHLEDDFLLSKEEQRVISEICEIYHSAGKKVIVVLNIGGVIETASWKDQPDAILLAWQPGQEGGNAIADVLTGAVNPSGRLSMTFPVDYFDIPSSENFPYDFHGLHSWSDNRKISLEVKNVDYTEYAEGMNVGYRYFNTSGVEVSYPFGYGLSFTNFVQTEPVFEPLDGGKTRVTVTVTNTGDRPGKDVVQIYDPFLKAFAKTKLLEPGESQTIVMEY